MIVLEDGRVFVAGTDPDAFMLDALHSGTWSPALGDRQYAPAVMYAPNKIIFIGGGNDPGDQRPTNKTAVIDFDTLTNPPLFGNLLRRESPEDPCPWMIQ
jgi:hypothetical protein